MPAYVYGTQTKSESGGVGLRGPAREFNSVSRLSDEKRSAIQQRLDNGESVASVARSTGVGYHTVRRIKYSLSRAGGEARKKHRTLSNEERAEVAKLCEVGMSMAALAHEYDVSVSTVSRICSGAK
jgi:transposase-like protein